MTKISKAIKKLMLSKAYLDKKQVHEKTYFKLNGKYCMYRNGEVTHQTQSEIAEYFKNDQIEGKIEIYTPEGDLKQIDISESFYDIWSFDPKIKTYHKIVFDCDVKNVPEDHFNLFDGFKHFDKLEKKDEDLEPIFEHIRTLVDYHDEMYEYIINFYAQIIQQPHILTHTVPVFISEQGIGKDILMNFMAKVIGEKYCCSVDKIDLLVGDFNGMMGAKLMCNVNETDPIESKKREDAIKFVTTAQNIVVNEKYESLLSVKTILVLIGFLISLLLFQWKQGHEDRELIKVLVNILNCQQTKRINTLRV